MARLQLVTAAAVLVLAGAACGGSEDSAGDLGLPTLEEETTTTASVATDVEADTEEAVLAFSQCMRDEGISGFPDPSFNADGSLDFQRGQAQLDEAGIDSDSVEFQAAFDNCQGLLEGVALIGGGFDLTEIQDLLLEFAQCMRDQGIDIPDPDLSFGAADQSPFGTSIDFNDPDVQAAFQVCQEQVNFQRLLEPDDE